MLQKNIARHPFCQPTLMAKTWYPTNFSGFYVSGKSYYKLTDTAIDTSKMKQIEHKLTPPSVRLFSDETVN